MLEQFDLHLLPYILGGSVITLTFFFLWLRGRKRMQQLADSQRQAVRSMEKEVVKSNNQLLEIRSVVVGLDQKVAEQQDIIQYLSERITELENTDTDSRLYSRASKMVQLGADIDELIEECDLPKAEAELMITLQNKISGRESANQTEKPSSSRAQKLGRKIGR